PAAKIVLLARQRGELEYADALARLRRDVLRCQGSRGQFEHQRQPMCSGLDFETAIVERAAAALLTVDLADDRTADVDRSDLLRRLRRSFVAAPSACAGEHQQREREVATWFEHRGALYTKARHLPSDVGRRGRRQPSTALGRSPTLRRAVASRSC